MVGIPSAPDGYFTTEHESILRDWFSPIEHNRNWLFGVTTPLTTLKDCSIPDMFSRKRRYVSDVFSFNFLYAVTARFLRNLVPPLQHGNQSKFNVEILYTPYTKSPHITYTIVITACYNMALDLLILSQHKVILNCEDRNK